MLDYFDVHLRAHTRSTRVDGVERTTHLLAHVDDVVRVLDPVRAEL
jgi:hypothetical protein